MPWLRRFIALLALTVLVLGALSTPAIPDLADSASSQADDVLAAADDRRADPITRPAPWPTGLQGMIAPLARVLPEPGRGFPPIKPAFRASDVGLLLAGMTSAAPAGSTGLDHASPLHESALGSARIPTGPPSPIV